MAEPKVKPIRRVLMSGHCATPSTANPQSSHERCKGYNTANPKKEVQPCPCPCHHGDTFECGGCGRHIVEMPALGLDEDGDPYYFHLDPVTGRASQQFCVS